MTHAPITSLRVMVVEDEPRLRELLLRAIPQMDFTAVAVRSGEEAIRAMEREPASILVLDLMLPGMSGLDVLEKVRQRWPSTAAVVLTGYGDIEAAKRAIRLEVADFLTKPCRLDELEQALDRARRRLIDPDAKPALRSPPELEAAPPSPVADAGTLEEVERRHILRALDRHHGNRAAAAGELGISLRTLYYRLNQYGGTGNDKG